MIEKRNKDVTYFICFWNNWPLFLLLITLVCGRLRQLGGWDLSWFLLDLTYNSSRSVQLRPVLTPYSYGILNVKRKLLWFLNVHGTNVSKRTTTHTHSPPTPPHLMSELFRTTHDRTRFVRWSLLSVGHTSLTVSGRMVPRVLDTTTYNDFIYYWVCPETNVCRS